MSKITHPYFGDLDSRGLSEPDVLWEGNGHLYAKSFSAWLWAGPGTVFDSMVLDAFAAHVDVPEKLDAAARRR